MYISVSSDVMGPFDFARLASNASTDALTKKKAQTAASELPYTPRTLFNPYSNSSLGNWRQVKNKAQEIAEMPISILKDWNG